MIFFLFLILSQCCFVLIIISCVWMLVVITLVLLSWIVLAFVWALLADWSLERPLEESKLWLLRRDDGEDWNEEKLVWLVGAAILVTLGIDSMLGARIRFGMLFRSISKSTKCKKSSEILSLFNVKKKALKHLIWHKMKMNFVTCQIYKKNPFNTLIMKISLYKQPTPLLPHPACANLPHSLWHKQINICSLGQSVP